MNPGEPLMHETLEHFYPFTQTEDAEQPSHLNTNIYSFAVKSILVQVLIVMSMGQVVPEDWVFNSKGCPAQLQGTKRGTYTVKNDGQKDILAYTLGCVRDRNQGLFIVYRFSRDTGRIVAQGWASIGVFDAPYTPEYNECVRRRNAKLAVLHLEFGDHTSWSFK